MLLFLRHFNVWGNETLTAQPDELWVKAVQLAGKKLEYNSDLSDFTLPFNPNTQPTLTVKRLNQIETKAGRDCVVYEFKCVTSKGDNVFGKAWLSETGVPVAMSYSYDPLSERLPKQIKHAPHEVYYQYHSGKWYPEKAFIELKSRHLFFNRTAFFKYTFSDYRKPKILELFTSGKPLTEGHKACVVPFEYIDNHIFVKVKINNLEQDYRFLLDTGASITVINPRTAAVLNFKKAAEMDVGDGYISKKADVVVIEKLILGEVAVENCGAAIFDMERIEAAFNIEIDGILGSDFLRFFAIRIDYLKKELVVAANCDRFLEEIKQSHRIPLSQGPTGLVFARLKISGVKARFKAEIDTGADSSLLVPLHYYELFENLYLQYRHEYDLGIFNGTMHWTKIINHFGLEPSNGLIKELHKQDVLSWTEINQELLKCIAVLRDKKVKQAILSNMPPDVLQDIRRKFIWLNQFDLCVFSCELGKVKLDPDIYRYCLDKLELEPNEAVFIE